MRIATWNVNSLKARLEKVTWWLDRARPDVLMMQETKLADSDVPIAAFEDAGYALAHHGEGRWNGVAIASRVGIDAVITDFGEPLRPATTADLGRVWWRARGVCLRAKRPRRRVDVLRSQTRVVRSSGTVA